MSPRLLAGNAPVADTGDSIAALASIRSLSVATGNRVIIGTAGAGAYVTRDDGRSWMISSIGLESPRLGETLFSPTFAKDDTVFATNAGYLQRSLNRGHFWQPTALSAPHWARALSHSYAPRFVGLGRFHKKEPVAPTTIAPSPRFAEDHTLFVGTRLHGVYRSLDGGESLLQVWAAGDPISALVVSPSYPADKTLFSVVENRGVFRSGDAGATWTLLDRGLPATGGNSPQPIARLLFSPEYASDKTVFAAGRAGLFRTTNRGDEWVALGDALLSIGTPITAAAVSPNYAKDSTLLINALPHGGAEHGTEHGAEQSGGGASRLYRSRDGGDSFARIALPRLPQGEVIHTLQFAAGYPASQKLYAASDNAILVGVRRGRRWIPIARPVRVEDTTPSVVYDGTWRRVARHEKTSAGSVHTSGEGLAEVTCNFVGTGVTWVGSNGPDQGVAKVYLDDEFQTDVDQFAPEFRGVATSYSISGLPRGRHSLRIVVLEDKNPSSLGARVEIDAFDLEL